MSIAGELLSMSESLLRDGLHPTEVAEGYAKAAKKCLEYLEDLVEGDNKDLDFSNVSQVADRLRGTIKSKQNGYEDTLAPLVAQACVDVCLYSLIGSPLKKLPTNHCCQDAMYVWQTPGPSGQPIFFSSTGIR